MLVSLRDIDSDTNTESPRYAAAMDLSTEQPQSDPEKGTRSNRPDEVVSIIVVSFNTKTMTIDCLKSIVDETRGISYEVIVFDNASTDGSLDEIEMEFGSDPRFSIIGSPTNLGFACANNEASKHARGDFLLLLNPDTIILKDAIGEVVDFAGRYSENGIWGGRTVFVDGTLNPGSCWGDYTLWWIVCGSTRLYRIFPKSRLFNPRAYPAWARDSVREVAVVTGCFLLIRRDFWEELEGFHPDFFMYGEEVDLCLRARAAGARPIITPDAELIHHGGASERVSSEKIIRLLDAEVRLLRRHWPRWKSWLAVLVWKTGFWSRAVFERFLPGDDPKWCSIWNRRSEWLGDSK